MSANGPDRSYQAAVGRRLRERRIHLGLSLIQAAEGTPWGGNTIGYWERAERALTVQNLHTLAVRYGVTTGDLMPAEDGPWWPSW